VTSGDDSDSAGDYYALLCVDAKADSAVLLHAWRQLAMRWHPDRAGPGATATFRKLLDAYAVLSDSVGQLNTVLSVLFIPQESVGGLYPLLGVGWTLNLEIYFYAVFALSILISQRWAPIVAASIILAVRLGLPHLTDNKAAVFYYSHVNIKYFIMAYRYGICRNG
jgi:peptidoglycan/LPS O-acetylase OafA/YrhL